MAMKLDDERRIDAISAVAVNDNEEAKEALFPGDPDLIAFMEQPGVIRVDFAWNGAATGPRPLSLTKLVLSEGNPVIQGTINTTDKTLSELMTIEHKNPLSVLSKDGHRRLKRTVDRYSRKLGIALITHDNIDDLIDAGVIRVKLPGHKNPPGRLKT